MYNIICIRVCIYICIIYARYDTYTHTYIYIYTSIDVFVPTYIYIHKIQQYI